MLKETRTVLDLIIILFLHFNGNSLNTREGKLQKCKRIALVCTDLYISGSYHGLLGAFLMFITCKSLIFVITDNRKLSNSEIIARKSNSKLQCHFPENLFKKKRLDCNKGSGTLKEHQTQKKKLNCKDLGLITDSKNLILMNRTLDLKCVNDEKLNESYDNTERGHQNRFCYLDLFRYHRLKIKQSMMVYMLNTNKYPASVCGIPWPMFHNEVYRLATYTNYPLGAIKSPTLLANNGFVYIGNGATDAVVCCFCGKEKKNWTSRDVIEDVHKAMSPNCPQAVNNTRSINLPETQVAANTASLGVYTGESSNTITSSEINRAEIQYQSSIEIQNQHVSNLNSENCVTGARSLPASIGQTETNMRSEQLQLQSMSAALDIPSLPATQLNDIPAGGLSANSTLPSLPDSENEQARLNSSNDDTSQQIPSNSTLDPTGSIQPLGRNPTYLELGIIADRPKRPEYALKIKRLETFALWPRFHPLTSEELADAGFYYADRGDSTRCFYCGGGLRNWEDGDEVWVEHARWFPRCSYLLQKIGTEFVDFVQEFNLRNEPISFAEIKQRLESQYTSRFADSEEPSMRRDPAVNVVLSLGYSESDVLQTAQLVKQECNHISADAIIKKLKEDGRLNIGMHIETLPEIDEIIETYLDEIRQMTERNNQIRQQIICKICLDSDVSVVFLPCGHLVSCGDCSTAMRDCPVCRTHVRGIARARIY